MHVVREGVDADSERATGPSGGARRNKPFAAAFGGDDFAASYHAGSSTGALFPGRANRGGKASGRIPPGGYDFTAPHSSASHGFGVAGTAAAAAAAAAGAAGGRGAAATSSNASSRRVFDAPRASYGGGEDERRESAGAYNNKPGYLFADHVAVADSDVRGDGIDGDLVNAPQRRSYAPASTSTSGFHRRGKTSAGAAVGSRPQKKTKRKSQGGRGASATANRHFHGDVACSRACACSSCPCSDAQPPAPLSTCRGRRRPLAVNARR